MVISTKQGMHRFSWDLHYQPIEGLQGGGFGGGDGGGNPVPHRTYPSVNSPWAPPGSYTVRLTVNGKHYTQPLTLKLDPRVKTPAAGLAQLASLSREMYTRAAEVHGAYDQARALSAVLDTAQGTDAKTFKARVDSIAPAPARGGRAAFFRRRGPAGPPNLESAASALMGAGMSMQRADATPTAVEVTACTSARKDAAAVMAQWNALRTRGLAAFNAKRKAAGQPVVKVP